MKFFALPSVLMDKNGGISGVIQSFAQKRQEIEYGGGTDVLHMIPFWSERLKTRVGLSVRDQRTSHELEKLLRRLCGPGLIALTFSAIELCVRTVPVVRNARSGDGHRGVRRYFYEVNITTTAAGLRFGSR